jgi:hypothetical protein
VIYIPPPALLMYTAKIWSHRTANYFYESNKTEIWLVNQDVIFSDTKILPPSRKECNYMLRVSKVVHI